MKWFTKLRHYNVPDPGQPTASTSLSEQRPHTSYHSCGHGSSAPGHTAPKAFMWVTSCPNEPKSPMRSCWRHLYQVALPTLRTLGQCMFGFAMLFIIAGIALCIWGYVGTAIKPFQIFGPLCIAIGCLIYVSGCILCCREYPAFERTLQRKAREEKTRRSIDFLGTPEVIEWIQTEPEVFEEFREISTRILYHHG